MLPSFSRPLSVLFACLLFSGLASPLLAGGKKDADTVVIEGEQNWSHSFDISTKKEGTYNLIAEGKDTAGNITVAGPINVFVDPDSDLPIAMIANPLEGMRVSGDLNIVGTCVDDDSVELVEVSIDSGEWIRGEGKDFWSLYFKAGEIADGRRTISTRGIDINGLEGPVHTIRFDMDRSRPGASISEPPVGALVAGRIDLKGIVTDDNSVVQVEYSLDDGVTYLPVKGSWDKKRKQFPFSARIDTRELEDGPLAILIRGVDGVGSVGITPTLFVIDNTKPVTTLHSPGEGEGVDRNFVLLGSVTDDVSVASLSWKIDKQGGDIPLTPGDPHWMVPIVLDDPKGKNIDVTLTALDTIGNKGELKVRLPLDLTSDQPLVTILEGPTEENPVLFSQGSVVLSGYARDDDGVSAVEYWVDKNEPSLVETTGTFSFTIEGLSAGNHRVNIRAVDIYGTPGPVSQIPVEEIGAPPTLHLAEVVYPYDSKEPTVEPFVPGMEFAPDAAVALRLELDGGSKLESLVYSFSGTMEQQVALKGSGNQSYLVPLPSSGPYGSLEFSAEVFDESGRSARALSHIYLTNYAVVRGDPRFYFTDERLDPDGTMRFGKNNDPLSGRFVGAILSTISFDGDAPGFSVTLDGNRVIITPPEQGSTGPIVLVGTTNRGHEFRSSPLRLVADNLGPDLYVDESATPFVGTLPLILSGQVSDPLGVADLSYRILNGASEEMGSGSIVLPETGSGFYHEVDVSYLPEGPFVVELLARDSSGNESIVYVQVFKDTTAPTTVFIAPSDSFDMAITAFYVEDSGGLEGVYAAEGEGPFTPLEGTSAFVVPRNSYSSSTLKIKVVDLAGNEEIISVDRPLASGGSELLALPEAAPTPVVQILSPTGNIGSEAILLFRIASDTDFTQVSWSLGSQKGTYDPTELIQISGPAATGTGGIYVGAVVVPSYQSKVGQVSASVNVRNVGGKSASASIKFNYDGPAVPELSVLAPQEEASIGTDLSVLGTASAPMGIASYTLVLDGKESFSQESSAGLTFLLQDLSPGKHKLALSATGRTGGESDPVIRNITVLGAEPRIENLMVKHKNGVEELLNGGSAVVDAGAILEGTLWAPNGLSQLNLRFGEGEPVKVSTKKLQDGAFAFQATLPQDLPYKDIEVFMEAVDPTGAVGKRSIVFFRVAPSEDPFLFDSEGLYVSDSRISKEEGLFRFFDSEPLTLRFVGRPIEEVRLEPPQSLIQVSFQGSQVLIDPLTDGVGEATSIIVRTIDGDEFTWGPVSFISDREDPQFVLEEPLWDGWFQDELPVSIRYDRESDIAGFEWNLDGSGWLPLELVPHESDSDLETTLLPFPGSDGGHLLRIRAYDVAGRTQELLRPVNRDTEAPYGTIVLPPAGVTMNGIVSLGALFSDNGALTTLEFSEDEGSTWTLGTDPTVLFRQVNLATPPLVQGNFESDADVTDEEDTDGDPKTEANQANEDAVETPEALTDVEVDPVSRFRFRAKDTAGNVTEIQADFPVDSQEDAPMVLIQLPEDNEVLRSDFVIAGAVYDDDGVAAIHFRIDEDDFVRIPVEGNSFSIPISLAQSSNNEHLVEIYGEDIYGVMGDRAERIYRISKEEPTAAISFPTLDTTVRGVIDVLGSAFDENGIDSIELSFDNAVTFNMAQGTEEWTYRLDTRNLKDGLHSIYLRPQDSYGITGFYAALISVDNTAPLVSLDVPKDLSTHKETLPLSGRVTDDTKLASCEAMVFHRGVEGAEAVRTYTLSLEPVVSQALDLSGLPAGEYGVRIIARDEAGNETVASRDFILDPAYQGEYIALASPVRGELITGLLRVQGFLHSPQLPSSVNILVNGRDIASIEPGENAWFSMDLDGEVLTEEANTIVARFTAADGRIIVSEAVDIRFSPTGPWVVADAFTSGAYVPARPWLTGSAGWIQGAEDARLEAEELSAIPKEGDRKKLAAKLKKEREVDYVELSLDNGRTFEEAKGRETWKFRLETLEYPEGPLPLVLRTHLKNGESSVSKLMLNLDKTSPEVSILYPDEGGRFNNSLAIYGIASDDVELDSVTLALRSGDKSGYEIPAFIQGLYLDGGMLGETFYNVGIGLTFFDNNVKLQGGFGYTPADFNGVPQRFFGTVISGKLLANVATFPFSFFFGPDLNFLSANIAVGAKFSYFMETSTGTPLMLSAVVAQLEFPKITRSSSTYFSSFSFYSEFQSWFISAEVDGGAVLRASFGLRTSIF